MQIIKIVNLEKYNPRKDRSKHSRVRVDNTIAFSEDLDGLEPDQKWFWIYLISQASFKQKDWLDLNFEYFVKHSGVVLKKIKGAIEHFEKRGMIQLLPQSVTTGNQSVSNGNPTVRDGTNVTNDTERNDTVQAEPTDSELFVEFWNALPFEELAKVKSFSAERRKKVESRLKEAPLDQWREVMLAIGQSDFLLGKKGDWQIDFDWLIENKSNREKILDGKYKNKTHLKAVNGSKAQAVMDRLKSQAERIAAGDL